ncbi:leucine-rich repeat protein, partial [Eubacterium sp.]|uniref:leucine-rich repeat protein n=1 Tax=Eubacterium sp. TaxID=142586 RepID=UPI003AF1091F
MRSVVVGKNVRVIGKNSFKGCKNLKTLVIKGKKLKKIKKGAFKNANSKIVIKCAKGQ